MKHKVNKKVSRRILSLILVVTMLATGLNLNVMAESIYASQRVKTEEKQRNEVTVVKELVNERTENSNTYLMSDGSKKLEILGENIRYEENGKLKDYDTSLSKISKEDKNELKNIVYENSLDEFKYVNESGDSKQYFPDEFKDKSEIVMSKGNYSLSFSLCTDKEKIFKAKVNNDEIRYEATDENVEYQYVSLKNGVKENIVLSSRPETNEFKYLLKGKNIVYKLLGSGEIRIQDKKTKKQIGRIVPPNIIDGKGNIDYTKVKYELENNDDSVFLKIVIDNEYLDNENTQYPLTVDPTAVWFSTKLPTTIVNSVTGRSDDVVLENTLLVENNYVYNEEHNTRSSRVYIDTANLIGGTDWLVGTPEISGKYIENSYLYLGEKEASKEYVQVDVKSVESSWNVNTITWNTQPKISNDVIATTWNKGVDGRNHGVNITKWVQAIADGDKENYGLVLEAAEEGTQCSYYGTVQPGSNFMCIDVIYRDFEQYDASIEATIGYDNETGKFQVSIEDTNVLDEGLSIKGYKVFARKNGSSKFASIYQGTDITENAEIDSNSDCNEVDYRVCILYSDGTVKPSNIVSFKQDTDVTQDEEGNNITTVSYEQTTFDTDGDGLEDGYEIWDFKTLWNTETSDSTEENPQYELDTDGDGFPDSYEVFILGTDPAVANEEGLDSDGDGWSNLTEYQKGTDPYLKDSDFDGSSDKSDPYPRYTSGNTRIALANQAEVHQGLYDVKKRVINDDNIVEYIVNIYSEQIKQAKITDCSNNESLTKQYYYDIERNNTAVIEKYSVDSSQTTCTTYTYDDNKQIIFVCSKNTRYSLDYKNEELSSFKVGNGEIIKHTKKCLLNNEGNLNNLQNGERISINQEITEYGNGQKIKSIVTEYKTENENDIARVLDVYLDDSETVSYRAEYNTDGNLTKFIDNTVGGEALVSSGNRENGILTVSRSDGFIKEQSEVLDEDGNQTSEMFYTFKNIKNNETKYSHKTEILSDNDGRITDTTLYNKDTVHTESSSEDGKSSSILYSKIYDRIILNTEREDKDNKTLYHIDNYAEDKNIDYVYDKNGNLIECSVNGKVTNEYTYDIKNRLVNEKEYNTKKYYEYVYDLDGNLSARYDYAMTSEGKKISNTSNVVYLEYGNSVWNGQITKYNGNEIEYDNVGNPVIYKKGENLRWERGNKLSSWEKNNKEVSYKYNENGLRSVKDTPTLNCKYEWDGNRLIREQVNYKATDIKYDIWYFYDGMNDVIGYEYSYINENGELSKNRIYYEKDLQGNVIALLDSRGVEIAKYYYDAWGNILDTYCYEGNETAYNLNNITYRSYYYDNDTGFYYLQNRYYDSETGRFLNCDNPEMINENIIDFYCYCDNNPVMYNDPSGMSGSYVFTIKEFYNESMAISATLNIYFVYMRTKVIEFKNERQFIEKWNSIKEADTIVINSHASYMGLGTASKYIVDSETVKKLRKIKCKALIVLGCESGDYTKIWKNIAYRLSSKISGIVVASDGPVTSYGVYVSNPKFTSVINKRHKWGWVLYKSGKAYDTWYSTNLIEITMPQILSYLRKCKLVSF